MKYISTRGKDSASSIDDVLKKGIADDGGLFLPESFPIFKEKEFNDSKSIIDTAKILLSPFFERSVLKKDLDNIIKECLSFFRIQSKGYQHRTDYWEGKYVGSPL